jgi:K+-sensing histidine kinase KdpD
MRLRHLHAFTRNLAGVLDFDGLTRTMTGSTLLGRRVVLLLPRQGRLVPVTAPRDGSGFIPPELEMAQAWWERRFDSGVGAVQKAWAFHRLAAERREIGLLAIERKTGLAATTIDDEHLAALLDQAALIIDRADGFKSDVAQGKSTSPAAHAPTEGPAPSLRPALLGHALGSEPCRKVVRN